ncbi:hypothetical protein FB451DRAFT_1396093 [Mycena latifolia]|nr:hypothetical protein FB451DRAFT_1396093 [Mycena latifolia]
MSTHGNSKLRDLPPHLSPPVASAAANSTVEGPSNFASTVSAVPDEPEDSLSSGERTSPPEAPSGLRVKLCMAPDGQHYLSIPTNTPFYASLSAPYRHPNAVPIPTSLRAASSSRSTLSEVSELQFSGSPASGGAPAVPGANEAPTEDLLDELVNGLSQNLTPQQHSLYSTVRGMLSTGRSALLTTTSFVVGQCRGLIEANQAIEKVRDETTEKLQALHLRVSDQEDLLERCLSDSVRVLRSFGSTEAHLAGLTKTLAEFNSHKSPRPEISLLPRAESRAATPLEGLQDELYAALAPRRPTETEDAFSRRGAAAVQRCERTAASFAPEGVIPPLQGAPSASAAHFARTARFEDPGSISSAPLRPFQRYTQAEDTERGIASGRTPASAFSRADSGFTTRTTGAGLSTFYQEKEAIIRAIVA